MSSSSSFSSPSFYLDISEAQEREWRERGFTVVDGLNVDEVRAEAQFPSGSKKKHDFGSDGTGVSYEVPSGFLSVDVLPFRLHRVAKRLLRSEGCILSQADVWIKHAQPEAEAGEPLANADQRTHQDGGNNQILPEEWHSPNAMAAIIYLDSDGVECRGGATAATPRLGPDDELYENNPEKWCTMQAGYAGNAFFNNRSAAEDWFKKNNPGVFKFRQKVYEREVFVLPRQGRVLLYRLDVWHHGTPLLSGSRRVMNLVYHRSADDPSFGGRWNSGFWRWSYAYKNPGSKTVKYAAPDALFLKLTPEQRTAIGLPAPGHPWWTAQRLRLCALRFPGFDPKPYYLGAQPQQGKL